VTAAARRFLVLAGDRALGLDSASAEASYRRALELSPEEEAGRAGVLAKLAEVLLHRARYAEADAALDEAIRAFRARGDVRDAAQAAARRSVLLWRLGDVRHGQLAAEAIELLEGIPPGPELVAVLADQAGDSLSFADYRASVAHADRAINLARELELPEPFRAFGFRGASRCNLGDPEGLGDLRRGLQLALTQGIGRDAAVIRSNLAFAIWQIEGPRSSLEANRELVDFARRRGFEDVVLWAAADSLQLLADLGSFDDVLQAAPDLIRRATEAGDVFALTSLVRRCSACSSRVGRPSARKKWACQHLMPTGRSPTLSSLPSSSPWPRTLRCWKASLLQRLNCSPNSIGRPTSGATTATFGTFPASCARLMAPAIRILPVASPPESSLSSHCTSTPSRAPRRSSQKLKATTPLPPTSFPVPRPDGSASRFPSNGRRHSLGGVGACSL
jgi:tetratricopeptide (TPR) repeat protein